MLPPEFLSQIADKYGFPQDQKEVFLEKFGNDKNDQEIMDACHISDGTLRYRLGKIYTKFRITGKGPGKAGQLLSFLTTEYQKFNASGSASSNTSTSADDLDALVQQVRQKRHEKIQHQCGTMRLLDISQPVALSDIYTDVNILEQITSQQWREISELTRDFNPESDDFDRLDRVVQERVPGLLAVSQYSKLMILGKPGSGKTTFLQWVAIKCDLGEFQSDRVPIFIRLKHFADDTRRDDSEFRLLNYISEEFVSCEIPEKSVIEMILTKGKALILLDGLDEVSEEDDEVVKQIRRFVNKYFKNQFIISCRIAAQKYTFSVENFTDVEVAGFNDEQVEVFAKKWFVAVARNDRQQGEATARRFIEKLNLPENKQIRELAGTPILLNLTCFVFQTKGEFPQKRFKLYKQGLDILLEKWDEERGIQRDEVYRNLSLDHKIELLTQIAAITFTNSRYFFEQEEVERYIADYIFTLPNAQTNRAILQQDSKRTLKSIEAQHGLLVERMRNIYSFSHLTFQEYFTAKWFVENANWQGLVSQFLKRHWREVVALAVEMMKPADELLCRMKSKIDAFLLDDKLQQFLIWLDQKSSWSFQVFNQSQYKRVAIRAYYLQLYRDLAINDLSLAGLLLLECASLPSSDDDVFNKFISEPSLNLDILLARTLNSFYTFPQGYEPIYIVMDLDGAIQQLCHADIKLQEFPKEELLRELRELFTQLPAELQKVLQQFKLQLQGQQGTRSALQVEAQRTNVDEDRAKFWTWWHTEGQNWATKLRTVMINYCNIGHEWQFSEKQRKALRDYYSGNRFLVECLNSSEVSHEVWQEIEDTLLLPIAEIEKRQQQIL
jgi:predicted NACHT family NTPase